MGAISIVIAVLIFSMIIAIHEFGHFAVAKLCGVKVNEFSIGMGPCLLKKKKGETQYSLRALPIGGYCAMEGEDSKSEDGRAFCNKSVPRRVAIVVAGAVMNLILGFILLIISTVVNAPITTTQVSWFEENASSQSTGLEIGDKIIECNGMRIFTDMDLSYQFQSDEDGKFDFVVERNGEKKTLEDVAFAKNDGVLHIDFKVAPQKANPLTVISYAGRSTVSYGRLIYISLGDLISGTYHLNDLSGPVGIVNAIGDVIEDEAKEETIDWKALWNKMLSMAAFITINVGLFNLLPLPALDGGRLMFLICEAITKHPVKPEHEGMVHFVGIVLLMLLMLVVTFNDIRKLF
ncbi:site-2 protease family protein [Ruminococcus sp. NK3A76]|uniref:M50 family metallopeptidase n=1 Tax=Ruminococcus sp. NK3A76 TaxID=877411 RepID=UPI00048BCC37|nr:site-2 protease family protein [Ruminococcus sp. NK3A76]